MERNTWQQQEHQDIDRYGLSYSNKDLPEMMSVSNFQLIVYLRLDHRDTLQDIYLGKKKNLGRC